MSPRTQHCSPRQAVRLGVIAVALLAIPVGLAVLPLAGLLLLVIAEVVMWPVVQRLCSDLMRNAVATADRRAGTEPATSNPWEVDR